MIKNRIALKLLVFFAAALLFFALVSSLTFRQLFTESIKESKRAEMLDRAYGTAGLTLDVHVQVNTSREASKYGLDPAALMPFLDGLARFANLRPRGLMTLAVLHPDIARVRPCFALLRRFGR